MINTIKNFFVDVKTEMGKVTWPTREELIQSTWVVIITMLLIAFYIGVCDFVFSHLVKFILR